jgi:hypothetical protein
MGFEHEGPEGVNGGDLCGEQGVRWEDRKSVRRWLTALEEAVKDLRAAGRDRMQRPRRRVLSRHEASRQLGEAWKRTAKLLRAGEAGLGPREPEPPVGGGPEDEPPQSGSRAITPSDPAS